MPLNSWITVWSQDEQGAITQHYHVTSWERARQRVEELVRAYPAHDVGTTSWVGQKPYVTKEVA